MRILIITNMWPSTLNPYYGIFVKEQFEVLSRDRRVSTDVFFINANLNGKVTYLSSLFHISKMINRSKFDVIHIHYGLSGLFLLFFKPKAKVYLTLHGGDILKRQGKWIQLFLTKKIIKKVDKVFVLNDEMIDIVSSMNVKYELLPCGVDHNFFYGKRTAGSDNNRILILFPGDPKREVKNFPLFLETMNVLNNNGRYIYEYKCIDKLSRAGVRDLMLSANCLLMTSISEGSPQVVKEALSCGLPVVSVPVGDVSQMLKNISCCYVTSKHDPVELSKSVELSISELNTNIRTQFIEKGVYDNNSVCNKLLSNYFV